MASKESIATFERDDTPILSPKELISALVKALHLEGKPDDEEDDSNYLNGLPDEKLSMPGKRRYSNK
jgi:hypothetical protein